MTTRFEIRRAYTPIHNLPIPILYKRCPKEELMIRDITIKAVLNGFVVTVGCQAVVFENRDTLMTELYKYLMDPKAVELEFRAKAINSKHLLKEDTIRNEAQCEARVATAGQILGR